MIFNIKSKKGLQLTMQLIVVIIILLVVLVFLIVFLTGEGGRLTTLWQNMVGESINETQAAVGP